MNHFGNAAGNGRSARTSCSRKGKKCHSDKPKQPQRGLGVAQLEKILHSQLGFHQTDIHTQMGMGELDKSNMAYVQSQPSSDPRWSASNYATGQAEHYANPGRTMHLFQVQVEDSLRTKWSDSMGSSSHNSDSNGSQELDLELRLSL